MQPQRNILDLTPQFTGSSDAQFDGPVAPSYEYATAVDLPSSESAPMACAVEAAARTPKRAVKRASVDDMLYGNRRC
eukprot:668569-Amorphochlora_amoeboformis.AAC.1